ncbi:hypothetical protein [Haladaptatus salinisoli]|nr:hypothetical protein [Haladaptatus salinisoli]
MRLPAAKATLASVGETPAVFDFRGRNAATARSGIDEFLLCAC